MNKIIDLSDRHNMFYWQTNRKLDAEETKNIFLERHDQINEKLIREIVKYGMNKAGFRGKDLTVHTKADIIRTGSVNSVIPVTLLSGRKIVLRIHPRQVKNGYFWVEKTATNLAKQAGVPTYETIFVDDSNKMFPYDFMIMTQVKGQPLSFMKPIDKKLEEKLITETGKYAGLINEIKTNGFGFFSNESAKKENILEGQYRNLYNHIYAALEEDLKFLTDKMVFTSAESDKMESLFHKNKDLLQIKQGHLIHNDIADWNELSDGMEITGIMDWDECFSGDPLMELAAYNLFFSEPRISWFKTGYNSVTKLEENEDKFQLFKMRYLISKMHLRTKRLQVDSSENLKLAYARGISAIEEVLAYFKI